MLGLLKHGHIFRNGLDVERYAGLARVLHGEVSFYVDLTLLSGVYIPLRDPSGHICLP